MRNISITKFNQSKKKLYEDILDSIKRVYKNNEQFRMWRCEIVQRRYKNEYRRLSSTLKKEAAKDRYPDSYKKNLSLKSKGNI